MWAMMEKLRMCFMKDGDQAPVAYTPGKCSREVYRFRPPGFASFAGSRRQRVKKTGNGATIERILGNQAIFVLQHRDANVVFAPPVRARIDITDLHIKPAAKQRHEFLDENITQMAAAAAVYPQARHSTGALQAFDNCRRELPKAAGFAQPPASKDKAGKNAADS